MPRNDAGSAEETRDCNAAAQRPATGPEDRSLSERCITYGSPQLTEGYQSHYQMVQTAASIGHDRNDSRCARHSAERWPHAPAMVRGGWADSRGHWEGDTLVVDTTNYKPRTFMGVSSEKLHVTERLSRTGPESLKYEITIDDPGTWTKPWSLMIPLRYSPNRVYEYACHEGNEGLVGILAGARAQESSPPRP